MSAALSSRHLGRPCPHSTLAAMALGHVFGQCPLSASEAPRGRLLLCFRINHALYLTPSPNMFG